MNLDDCFVPEGRFCVDADPASRSWIHAMGRDRDTLVRCGDRRWRFVERSAEVDDG